MRIVLASYIYGQISVFCWVRTKSCLFFSLIDRLHFLWVFTLNFITDAHSIAVMGLLMEFSTWLVYDMQFYKTETNLMLLQLLSNRCSACFLHTNFSGSLRKILLFDRFKHATF